MAIFHLLCQNTSNNYKTQNTYITPDDYYNTNIITRQIFSSQVIWLSKIVIPTSHYVEFQYVYVANACGYKRIKLLLVLQKLQLMGILVLEHIKIYLENPEYL
jgi:hypothetical protein